MSIKKISEGHYRFRVMKDGVSYEQSFSGTEKAAQKAHDEFKLDVKRGNIGINKKMKFGDFSQLWYDEYAKINYAPTTMDRALSMLEGRILKEFSKTDIGKIAPIQITKFYNKLGKEMAGTTVNNYHRLLRTILQKAVDWEIIESNPCSKVKPPKKEKKKIQVYNKEQVLELFQLLDKETTYHADIIYLALASGCRRSEICALKESNIDFINHTITIGETLHSIRKQGTVAWKPKTEHSYRTIPIPKSTMDRLSKCILRKKKLKVSAGNKFKNTDYVFVKPNGEPINPDYQSRWFKKFITENNLPPITFHQLRHTSATLLLYEGVNIQTISTRLGHGNVNITTSVYLHDIESEGKVAADKLEEIFTKAN